MTYKDKLIDLLKSDDETREAMEKLEFGCKVKKTIENEDGKLFFKYGFYINGNIDTGIFFIEGDIYNADYDIEIIGLPLQERFLRMYLKNKGIENTIIINTSKLDHNRDFDNQDDDIYQKIYEALNNLITK